MEARNQNDSWAQECWERTAPRWSKRAQQWALIYCWGILQSEWGDSGGSPILQPIISSVFPRDVFTRLDVKKKGNCSVLSLIRSFPEAALLFYGCLSLTRVIGSKTVLLYYSGYQTIFSVIYFDVALSMFNSSFRVCDPLKTWTTTTTTKTCRGKCCIVVSHRCLHIAHESTWAGLFRSCRLFNCLGCLWELSTHDRTSRLVCNVCFPFLPCYLL